MRFIAFITERSETMRILKHIGEQTVRNLLQKNLKIILTYHDMDEEELSEDYRQAGRVAKKTTK